MHIGWICCLDTSCVYIHRDCRNNILMISSTWNIYMDGLRFCIRSIGDVRTEFGIKLDRFDIISVEKGDFSIMALVLDKKKQYKTVLDNSMWFSS